MKGYKIKISGNWAHFRHPETNNNPISFDFIPKTALIGLMASVVGLKRDELKENFETFCKEIKYSIEINNPITKISHSFRIYKYQKSLSTSANPPQAVEILKSPSYNIVLVGDSELLQKFIINIKTNKSVYTPTLGLINCPADVEFIEEFDLVSVNNDSSIETNGLVPKESDNTNQISINSDLMVSYDKIPTSQNNSWLNTESKEVFYSYSYSGASLKVKNSKNAYQKNGSNEYWFFI